MITVILLLIMAVSGTVKAQTKNDQNIPFSFDDHVLTEVIDDVFDDLPDEEFAEENVGSTKGGNPVTDQTFTKIRTGSVVTTYKFYNPFHNPRRALSRKRHSR